MLSAHSQGPAATCYRWRTLQVVPSGEEHITENTLEECEQQPERSVNLNFIISGLRILFLEEHTALCWAPFQEASPWHFFFPLAAHSTSKQHHSTYVR